MSTPVTSLKWRITFIKRTLGEQATTYYLEVDHTFPESIVQSVVRQLVNLGYMEVRYRMELVLP